MLETRIMREELARHYDLAPSVEAAEPQAGLYARVDKVMSPVDYAMHAPYVGAINKLKRERDAVILAQKYMTPEIYTASVTWPATACSSRTRRPRSRRRSTYNAAHILWPRARRS